MIEDRSVYVAALPMLGARLFKVTAMFTDQTEANRFMEANPDHAVIREEGPVVFLANVKDAGIPVPK